MKSERNRCLVRADRGLLVGDPCHLLRKDSDETPQSTRDRRRALPRGLRFERCEQHSVDAVGGARRVIYRRRPAGGSSARADYDSNREPKPKPHASRCGIHRRAPAGCREHTHLGDRDANSDSDSETVGTRRVSGIA